MPILKQISHASVYLILRGIAGVVRFLPWRLGATFGSGLGTLFFLFSNRYKTRAIENYKMAFGLDTLDALSRNNIKKSFKNIGKSLIEIFNLQHLDKRRIDDLVSLEGEEYLKGGEGRGTLLITGHIGNWELMGAVLGLRGYKIHAIATPLYDVRLNDWLVGLRARFSVDTISRGTPSSSRKILGILRSKEDILALLIDQDTHVNGVFVPFFNKRAYTPSGAAQLMLRSHPHTVIAFIVRLPDNRHRITIQKPVGLPKETGDTQKDVETYTAFLTAQIEEQIRRYPDQWIWLHRRWKTRPTNESRGETS